MGPRFAIAAGLLAGLGVAAILVIGVLALSPDPSVPAAPTPSIALESNEPSASPASPSASTASATTPAPGSPAASASLGAGSGFHIGQQAPSLVVPQVGGATIDLAALRGKPVWVNFMATWCPPCQDEFPLMNGFAARYGSKGLVVLAIDVKEEEGVVAGFARGLGATFPLGLDGDGHVAQTWDAIALPVHFWIDAKGVVRDGALGGIGADVMARGLRSILPGVDVTP
ncbi:MAG: cytochrome c biosis protein CcmG, thiol:disulfide interchange protein DsbE [Chloroflexota bacterium]|jgi:thiol-disulfide isomerase/thioredoxin|nr:cytochrome c biosis protein CcmG, thiol:disulfide interchange protein DsbE [Chloroflexota bacterium]